MDNEFDNFFVINESKDIEFLGEFDIMFYFDKNRYFFKGENYCGAFVDAELLAAKLGQKLGIDVLQVKPAVFRSKSVKKDYFGVMSENFFYNNLKVSFDYVQNNKIKKHDYQNIVSAAKEYVQKTNLAMPEINLILEKDFYSKLRDMIFFDFLTFQGDRFPRNIEFVLKKRDQHWEMCLAPIFDNSWIFGFEDRLYDEPEFQLSETYVKRFLANHKYVIGFKPWQTYDGMAEDILSVFRHNKRYQMLAKKAYQIDIEQCIEEVESENEGIIFDCQTKKRAKYFWDVTKKTLEEKFDIKNLDNEFCK